ncbi:hypothetical protein BDW22DRAFT_1355597 [Trametopsis cervina]|nr:hypothetical protein BDW22DRAFT_1355597 [Trametopsis cervina]
MRECARSKWDGTHGRICISRGLANGMGEASHAVLATKSEWRRIVAARENSAGFSLAYFGPLLLSSM